MAMLADAAQIATALIRWFCAGRVSRTPSGRPGPRTPSGRPEPRSYLILSDSCARARARARVLLSRPPGQLCASDARSPHSPTPADAGEPRIRSQLSRGPASCTGTVLAGWYRAGCTREGYPGGWYRAGCTQGGYPREGGPIRRASASSPIRRADGCLLRGSLVGPFGSRFFDRFDRFD